MARPSEDPEDPDDIPKAFCCPITCTLMKEPVLLLTDGYTYDCTAILTWFENGKRISPMTKQPVNWTNGEKCYVTNRALKDAITEWKQKRAQGTTNNSKGTKRKAPTLDGGPPRKKRRRHGTTFDMAAFLKSAELQGYAPELTQLGVKTFEDLHKFASEGRPIVLREQSDRHRLRKLTEDAAPQQRREAAAAARAELSREALGRLNQQLYDECKKKEGVDVKTVQTLLAKGADPNWKNSNMCYDAALHSVYDARLVPILIAAGANVDAKLEYGATPLHRAAYHGKAAVAVRLLAAKADVEAKDSHGQTPLHSTAYHGEAAVARVLLEPEWKVDVNAKGNNGATPLHLAALFGQAAVARVLLELEDEKKPDVNAKNDGGWTPLHCAAICGKAAVADLLLVANADVNAKRDGGRTPLHDAAGEVAEVARLLLRQKADATLTDDKGETALDVAREEGKDEVIALLEAANTRVRHST